jgi:O-antigen ligase
MTSEAVQTPDAATEPGADRRRPELAGVFVLMMLAVVWSWWACKDGAYFGVVLLPGTIVLCAGLVILARVAPWRGRLSPRQPAAIALFALIALAAWAGLSALWSPAPEVAITDGLRIAVYALSFGLGIWLAILLGSRSSLSMVPLAVAGAAGGIAVLAVLLTGDHPGSYLEDDATLVYPLGYRNANAAFFAVAFFPALGLAADRGLDWRARAVALGAATLCLEMALLSQSRGSIPATAVALIVYVVAAPVRVRALCWLALAVLPALGLLPAMTDLYGAANEGDVQSVVGVLDEMRSAGTAAGAMALLAVVLGGLAILVERRLPDRSPGATRVGNRAVLVALAATAAALAVGFVVKVGDPVGWVGDRVDEFTAGGQPNLSQQSSRFGINLQSNRSDVWRVALDDGLEDPLLGDGGGGFHYSYTRQRDTVQQTAHDAHSIELEVLSELGVPGLLLLLTVLGGAAAGALRARRLGPQSAALAAIALSTGAYWLTHTSVDWFWAYPAIAAPVLALLGSGCAAALRTPEPRPARGARRWLIAGAVVVALSTVPFFLSERYVNGAYAEWRSDLTRAYQDLDRAAALTPFSDTPLLAEGAIADAAGDRERAISAFREAARERPEEWASHYLLAKLYKQDEPELARKELEKARALNPLSEEIRVLGDQLGVSGGGG